MFCPNCGNELQENAKFCAKCGTPTYANTSGYADSPVQQNKKKKMNITMIIVVIVVAVLLLAAVALGILYMISVQEEKKYIDFVKNGSPESYSDITYAEAFDTFFEDPSWEYFEGENGEDVVEFSGDCLYEDTEVTANIQFILDYDDGTFEAGAFSMNGVPQNQFMTAAIISTVFDDYRNGEDTDSLNVIPDEEAAEEAEMETQTDGDVQDDSDAENSNYDASDLDQCVSRYDALVENAMNNSTYEWDALCDIDRDGLQELLLCEGNCEAEYICNVYTLSHGNMIKLGEFDAGNSGLYRPEDGSTGLICVSGHMGVESINMIYKNGNTLDVENTFQGELEPGEDYYSTPYLVDKQYRTRD